MFTYKITNQALFDATVTDIDVSGLKSYNGSYFRGSIELNGKTHTGQFGANDYKTEHGFKIVFAG